jgi:CBS domain containing-hemolysin-like protein
VIGDDVDDVAGVVHLRRAVAVPRARRAEVPVSALMSEPLRVPETVRLPPLLLELRTSGLQLAVVVDEYGGTAGVVTLEDLVEELIGELSDEHDLTRAGAVRDGDGSWLVPGLMRPDEVRDQIGFDVPDGPAYETLGGFVMALLGRVPAVGDEVAVPGAVARVERMEGRRVDRIRLIPATIPAAPHPQPGEQGTEAVSR